MVRQNEFKPRFDPEFGRYIIDESIHGEGLMDVFKVVGSKIFSKTAKELASKGVKTGATKAVTKTGEHIGNKAGH